MGDLPISAIVVGYNEGHFLERAFASVDFCSEILYTDLGSTDNSLEIANRFGARIFFRDRSITPSCEMAQHEMIKSVKNRWVLFIDPDEEISSVLRDGIFHSFSDFSRQKDIGAVLVPWVFYFKKKRLKGTIWGGFNRKFLVVHNERFVFSPVIHYGRYLKDGYQVYSIQPNSDGSNVLHHYWMNSFWIFIKKHLRYLKHEGRDRYNSGVRIGFYKLMLVPFKEFHKSYIEKKGYLDGLVGLFLSFFWAFYQTVSLIRLYKIQVTEKK